MEREKKKQPTPFKSLNNIAKTFSFARTLSLVTIGLSVVFSITVCSMSYRRIADERNKIYVLDEGRSLLMALSQDLTTNRPVEARDHVRMFHEYFFTLSPDNEAIKHNIARAIDLADRSAYNYYMDLAESGYYRRLIRGNMVQIIKIDSIVGNFDAYPYRLDTYATQSITRESMTVQRSLVTTCELVNTTRSDKNPHGFLLRDFRILNNQDIRQNEN